MSRLVDLSGRRFGRLLVSTSRRRKASQTQWECNCTCGATVWVSASHLKAGRTRSCGCLSAEVNAQGRARIHGDTHKRGTLYGTWTGIKYRCSSPKHQYFAYYGGRGIQMYHEWLNNYLAFKTWILTNLGPRPDGHSLDRIDNDGNYEPGNLRWATRKEQAQNQRRHVAVKEVAALRSEVARLKSENARLRAMLGLQEAA